MHKNFKFWLDVFCLSFLFENAFGFISKIHGQVQHLEEFSCNSLIILYFSPWHILSYYLYMLWGRGPTSLFCIWISSCFCTICWRDYFPPLNILGIFVKNQLAIVVVFFAGLSIVVHWSICLYWHHHHNQFWNWEVWILRLCFSFSTLFWLCRALVIPYEF